VEPIVTVQTPPSRCEYLHDRQSRLLYELTPEVQPIRYMRQLEEGWRRIGPVVFRPDCPTCARCQSLRVPIATFSPSESQRRTRRRNEGDVQIRVAAPSVDAERLDLYASFHSHGHRTKGWPAPDSDDSGLNLFLLNPFPTEEWSYWIDGRLAGIGYVDVLPDALSAIYFFHDPAEHRRSLGTFNVLKLIDAAAQQNLPHLYLGYYVAGCRSLEYKAKFRPNEVLTPTGWQRFVG
jgi:arginine-tRNA-protein transferase